MFRILSLLLIACVVGGAGPLVAYGAKEVTTFEIPDVRSQFCGPELQHAFCRCAFYEQGCDVMNMSQDRAHAFVEAEYRKWVARLIEREATQCIANNGYWNKNTRQCITCTEGDVRSGQKCLPPGSEVEADVARPCQALVDFAADWKKYSDFDEAVQPADASVEVQEYRRVLDELSAKIAEAHTLEYEMEVDRQIRNELQDYKTALVNNMRDDITHAIFRLAWVTYHTVKGVEGTAGSYRTLVNPDSAVEALDVGLKTIQDAVSEEDGLLQFDTSNAALQVQSGAWNATLEALERVVDPRAIALQAIKDVQTAAVSGPDLTDEEVEILRTQHLENLQIDKALAESYAENSVRRLRLINLEQEIATLYNEMESWRAQEYARVQVGVETTCQN